MVALSTNTNVLLSPLFLRETQLPNTIVVSTAAH
jgi:hypothetical protein